jgi:hypothetical protein
MYRICEGQNAEQLAGLVNEAPGDFDEQISVAREDLLRAQASADAAKRREYLVAARLRVDYAIVQCDCCGALYSLVGRPQ